MRGDGRNKACIFMTFSVKEALHLVNPPCMFQFATHSFMLSYLEAREGVIVMPCIWHGTLRKQTGSTQEAHVMVRNFELCLSVVNRIIYIYLYLKSLLLMYTSQRKGRSTKTTVGIPLPCRRHPLNFTNIDSTTSSHNKRFCCVQASSKLALNQEANNVWRNLHD